MSSFPRKANNHVIYRAAMIMKDKIFMKDILWMSQNIFWTSSASLPINAIKCWNYYNLDSVIANSFIGILFWPHRYPSDGSSSLISFYSPTTVVAAVIVGDDSAIRKYLGKMSPNTRTHTNSAIITKHSLVTPRSPGSPHKHVLNSSGATTDHAHADLTL